MNATLSAGTRSAVPTPVDPPAPVPAVVRVTIALSGAALAGVLTSFGQAVPALASVSNSAGPWFLVSALLCLAAGARAGRFALPLAMVLGVVLLELMHVGYWATTVLRGFPDVLSITNPWVLHGGAGRACSPARSPWPCGPATAVARGGVRRDAPRCSSVRASAACCRSPRRPGVVTWIVEIVVGAVVLARRGRAGRVTGGTGRGARHRRRRDGRGARRSTCCSAVLTRPAAFLPAGRAGSDPPARGCLGCPTAAARRLCPASVAPARIGPCTSSRSSACGTARSSRSSPSSSRSSAASRSPA